MLCVGSDFGKHGHMGNGDLVGYPSDVSDEEWAFVASYLALAVFQLPTSSTPIMIPSSISIIRDRPLQISVLPG